MSTPRATAQAELARLCAIDRPLTTWVRRLADLDREAWQVLERAMRGAHDHLLVGAWPRLLAGFRTETAWRSRQLAHRGLRETLTGLSPALRWHGTSLEADSPRDLDVPLDGRGLVLQPSLFWTGPPLVAVYAGRPALLIYPAVTPLPLLADDHADRDVWPCCSARPGPRVLRLLTRQHTTTGLPENSGQPGVRLDARRGRCGRPD